MARFLFPHFLSLLLIVSLSLGARSAFALRPQPDTAGLEEADRITFLGEPKVAQFLIQSLPASMQVISLDPMVGFKEIFLALGIQPKVVDQINAAGLEQDLERLHSA